MLCLIIKNTILVVWAFTSADKGIPIKIVRPYIWALSLWGGLNACPDGLGHLLREELSKFKRASACFGGIVIQYYLKFPLPPIVAGLSPSNLKDREVQYKKEQ